MTETEGEIRIDNGEPVTGTLTVEHNVEIVRSLGPKPDPKWSFVDAAGHFHAFDQNGERRPYPTLTRKSRHHDCDGFHTVDTIDNEDEECEGWDETYYVCRICDEEIEPGEIPGPHETQIAHPDQWRVETVGADLWNRLGGNVTVRATNGETVHFGVALVTSCRSADDPSMCAATLLGNGPLGRRTVRK